jgi:hypothetical protein
LEIPIGGEMMSTVLEDAEINAFILSAMRVIRSKAPDLEAASSNAMIKYLYDNFELFHYYGDAWAADETIKVFSKNVGT